MIEGAHIIAAYRDKLGMPVRLIVSEHGVAQAEIQALCSSLPDVETLLLRDNLFNTLSGLATPPGIWGASRTRTARRGSSTPPTGSSTPRSRMMQRPCTIQIFAVRSHGCSAVKGVAFPRFSNPPPIAG